MGVFVCVRVSARLCTRVCAQAYMWLTLFSFDHTAKHAREADAEEADAPPPKRALTMASATVCINYTLLSLLSSICI